MAKEAQKRITVNAPELSEYKGNRLLVLNPNGRANMSFGLGKAMVIMENLPAICAFLKSDGKSLEMLDAGLRARIESIAAEILPKSEEDAKARANGGT